MKLNNNNLKVEIGPSKLHEITSICLTTNFINVVNKHDLYFNRIINFNLNHHLTSYLCLFFLKMK